jgi:hypothetical protein
MAHNTRLNALPGSIATTNDDAGNALRSKSKRHLPHQQRKRKPSRPAPERVNPKPVSQDLSAVVSDSLFGSFGSDEGRAGANQGGLRPPARRARTLLRVAAQLLGVRGLRLL